MADTIRERVYAAQTWITGYQMWTSTRDADAFIRYMERDVRFKERYPDHRPVRVFRLKRELGSVNAYYRPATHGIYLPYWAQNMRTIVHEMCHAVTPLDPGHGAQFCREYYWLVLTFMSQKHADQLERGYRANDIKALDYDDSGRRTKDLGNTSK